MNILVSACLIGVNCRYSGKSEMHCDVLKLMERHTLIPVCPEIYGGLATPRVPAEISGDKVITKDGLDVTKEYMRGAEEVLRLARLYSCKYAVMKERSPSCGFGKIYDGTHSGTLTDGSGICTDLLNRNGIIVVGESMVNSLLDV